MLVSRLSLVGTMTAIALAGWLALPAGALASNADDAKLPPNELVHK